MDDLPLTTANGARSWAAVGDDVLLARARADGAAFVAVFERHAAPLFRFAAHRVGAAAAEDVLAETFARAFARRHAAYTTEGSLRAWLHAIARNLIADELRSQAPLVAGACAGPGPRGAGRARGRSGDRPGPAVGR